MRAVEVARFGGPDVLELRELPDPVPGPGQVLVAASACDVLFVDTVIRSGRGTDYFPIRPPYVPGNGVGGTVVAVGDGVEAGWLGRPVVGHTGGAGGTGGYAELAVIDLEACVPRPDGVDLLDATAVLHDGTTALASWRRLRRRRGNGHSSSAPPAGWGSSSSNCWSPGA